MSAVYFFYLFSATALPGGVSERLSDMPDIG